VRLGSPAFAEPSVTVLIRGGAPQGTGRAWQRSQRTAECLPAKAAFRCAAFPRGLHVGLDSGQHQPAPGQLCEILEEILPDCCLRTPEAPLDRHIVDLITEVARTGQRDPGPRAPLGITSDANHHDAVAVAQVLGGNGVSQLGVEHGDQVRHRGDDGAIPDGNQVFVLELHHHATAAIGVAEIPYMVGVTI